MSAYPLMLDGSAIVAVVVGGGEVATRKVRGLLDAGARVNVVAPHVSDELEALAQGSEFLNVMREMFDLRHLDGATLVVAATNDTAVNAVIAEAARGQNKLVNVVDAPELGTCVTPALYRNGDIVVAVSTGRVPAAAARIRDAITSSLDNRHADAVRELSTLRRTLLTAGERDKWRDASRALITDDFCAQVESGALHSRIGEWR